MEMTIAVHMLGQDKQVTLLKSGSKRHIHLPQVGRSSCLICRALCKIKNVGPLLKILLRILIG